MLYHCEGCNTTKIVVLLVLYQRLAYYNMLWHDGSPQRLHVPRVSVAVVRPVWVPTLQGGECPPRPL
jgi:hypothetical protein